MKWPWVSREHHEDVVRHLERAHHAAMVDFRLRADDALIRVVETLTKPPAVTTLDTAPLTLTPAPEADAIAKTIREEAGRDTHLAQHLRKYARELKAQGLTEDEIVGKLVAWQTSEPEDHVASA